jgi:hypothetical protein
MPRKVTRTGQEFWPNWVRRCTNKVYTVCLQVSPSWEYNRGYCTSRQRDTRVSRPDDANFL